MSNHEPATPLPWHYVSGAVWNNPQGIDGYGCACVAMRASNAPIAPADRDTNIAYLTHAANAYPRLVEALTKALNANHLSSAMTHDIAELLSELGEDYER